MRKRVKYRDNREAEIPICSLYDGMSNEPRNHDAPNERCWCRVPSEHSFAIRNRPGRVNDESIAVALPISNCFTQTWSHRNDCHDSFHTCFGKLDKLLIVFFFNLYFQRHWKRFKKICSLSFGVLLLVRYRSRCTAQYLLIDLTKCRYFR